MLNDSPKLKDILERLGVIHSVKNEGKIIEIDNMDQAYSLTKLLTSEPTIPTALRLSSSLSVNNIVETKDAIEFVSKISGFEIMPKFASSISVRVGRPEKAAERKMKPPVHALFPVGSKGGATRDILKAAKEQSFYAEISNRFCSPCKQPSTGAFCRYCSSPTPVRSMCITCKEETANDANDNKCYRCGKEGKTYSPVAYPLKTAIEEAQQKLGIKAAEPLKGVKALISKDKSVEPLEKGILRQKNSLFTFKDGTIRFDATNEPLTHFKPKWTMISIEKLRELGYTRDYLDKELVSSDQLVELLMQDILIPLDCAKHLLNVAKYVDGELVKLYGLEPFYNAASIEDLIGEPYHRPRTAYFCRCSR